jgi:predicted dehydrogenase
MSEKIRVGVIGCGQIAQKSHFPHYSSNPDVEIVAADSSQEQLDEVCRLFDVRQTYYDYEKMLDEERLDAVSICSPNFLHCKMTVDAAERGVHVLCEKPMATTLADAEIMLGACSRNSVILMVNFTYRFFNGTRRTKQLLDEGVIGKLHSIRVRFGHRGPYDGWGAKSDWFFDAKKVGGGVLMDMGIHAIDICHYLFGPITSVCAVQSNLSKKIPVEDSVALLTEFGDGRFGTIEACWTGGSGFVGIEVCGSAGSITLDFRKGFFLSLKENNPDGLCVFEEEEIDCDMLAGGHETVINDFIEHIQNGTRPVCNGSVGLAALKVALAAYESAKSAHKIII